MFRTTYFEEFLFIVIIKRCDDEIRLNWYLMCFFNFMTILCIVMLSWTFILLWLISWLLITVISEGQLFCGLVIDSMLYNDLVIELFMKINNRLMLFDVLLIKVICSFKIIAVDTWCFNFLIFMFSFLIFMLNFLIFLFNFLMLMLNFLIFLFNFWIYQIIIYVFNFN